MTATIGMQLRVDLETHEAMERVAPRGKKTKYIIELIRRDLQRRGELPKEKVERSLPFGKRRSK